MSVDEVVRSRSRRNPGPAATTAAARRPRSVAVLSGDAADDAAQSPFAEGVHDELDADLRHRMVGEAAYYLAERRGFEEGYEVEDWLQAEADVDHMLLRERTGGNPP